MCDINLWFVSKRGGGALASFDAVVLSAAVEACATPCPESGRSGISTKERTPERWVSGWKRGRHHAHLVEVFEGPMVVTQSERSGSVPGDVETFMTTGLRWEPW